MVSASVANCAWAGVAALYKSTDVDVPPAPIACASSSKNTAGVAGPRAPEAIVSAARTSTKARPGSSALLRISWRGVKSITEVVPVDPMYGAKQAACSPSWRPEPTARRVNIPS